MQCRLSRGALSGARRDCSGAGWWTRSGFVSAGLTLILCCVVPAAEPPAPRLIGLGSHGRRITTTSPAAQDYFNQGLALLYAYNHDEAIRSFRQAAQLDPEAAMPHWGIAYALGPHINFPMMDEAHAASAWEELARARDLAVHSTPVERDLIAALAERYALPQPEDRKALDAAYASAMRALSETYPHDADIAALFAEALMNLRPWDLWTPEGELDPVGEEAVAALDRARRQDPDHALALHLYIHAVEGSAHPERAATAADRLRDLQPGLGHLVHMPSHIDLRLGAWEAAVKANEKAILADRAYRAIVPEQGFFRTYMAHNHHMLAFAAMMQGRSERATRAIREMLEEIPADWAKENAALVDAMFAMPYELHLRFGRWDEMLAEPEPPEYFRVARAVRLYARGVAFAAQKKVPEARAEQAKFLAARDALPEDAMFVLNTAADVLGVAEQMLAGEILYREGKTDEAVAALRLAVEREDALRYIEPPDWIQPVRHALGATLMDARRYAEAEAVYRDDLKRFPNNGWSLYGLSAALRAQGQTREAEQFQQQFQQAWKQADFQLTSSCCCLPGPPGKGTGTTSPP